MKEIAEPRYKTVRIKVLETLYNYAVKKLHWAVRDMTKSLVEEAAREKLLNLMLLIPCEELESLGMNPHLD